MSRHLPSWLMIVFLPLAFAFSAHGQDDEIKSLILRAGNAGDDVVRLDILKQLGQREGLDPQLKKDADRLVAEIDQWLHAENMTYFGKQVVKTNDYDFGIAEASPLYPITCIYQARMLVWLILESGNAYGRQAQFLGKARKLFEQAKAVFPENRIVRMYLGEPIPPTKEYPAVEGAPAWAVHQREGLERLADIIEWWIDHRMREDGQYGGGWGDDCEMWRWWVPVLIAFDDPKISAAQARFSEAMMNQDHMKDGYTSRVYDVEHTAEDSADVITPMMHLDPDNPVWKKRALRLAELMETLWTGRNERGFLQFKSTYFAVARVDDKPERACDTVYHPRAVQPALLYWLRTRDDKLGRLFTAWMDTWVDAAARAERGKPAGIVPSAIHWPDGQIGGTSPDWWDPRNHNEPTLYRWPSAMSMMVDTLLQTYHITGEAKYLQPIQSMADIRRKHPSPPSQEELKPGTEQWCAAKMGFLNGALAKYRLLTGDGRFDDLLERSAYMAFRLKGEATDLVGELKNTAEALRPNFPGYTSEVRYTDRVLRFPSLFQAGFMVDQTVEAIKRPSPQVLYSAATGDPGDVGYFPLNAVRWLTPPRGIAALVTAAGADRFEAQLFHFGDEARDLSAELYLLAPGEYEFQVTLADGSGGGPNRVAVSGPRTRIDLHLPSRRLCTVRVAKAED
ncbi:MAG: hypothetical protein AB1696_07990 [Planctomycetota bacterium]